MKLKRLGGLSTALVLLALAALAPAVSATQVKPELIATDIVDQAGLYEAGVHYNAARVTLAVYNGGGGTYTQVALTVEPCVKGSDPCVPDTSVVARAALDATQDVPVFSSYCTVVSGNKYQCTLPNIPGGATSPAIEFVYSSASGMPFDLSARVSIKEQTNAGTSNLDRTDEDSELIQVDVSARSDKQTPFFPPNQSFTVSTWKQGNVGQRATLKLPSSSNGYLVDLQEFLPGEEPLLPVGCSDLTTSETFGQLVAASVNNGTIVSPYLEWTLEITFGKGVEPEPLNKVLHCTLNGGAYVVDEITTGTGDKCGTPTQGHGCMVWSKDKPYQTKTTGNKKTGNFNTTYIVTIRTLTNGWAKTTK
jgi:hypothetical protein